MTDPRKRVVTLLIEYMKETGMSQGALAATLGIAQSSVSNILSGRHGISDETLRNAARVVGVTLAELGYAPAVADRLDPTALELAGYAVKAASDLRNAGMPSNAADHLWPVYQLLERAHRAGQADPDFALLLCHARMINAIVVGDLSSEADHKKSVYSARRARQLANVYGDDNLKANVLNLLGNQLRVLGELNEAQEVLTQATLLSSATRIAASSYTWLARIAAEQGHRELFFDSILQVRTYLDDTTIRSPLLNELSVSEVESRGLVQLGESTRALTILDGIAVNDIARAAPQWEVLSAVTRGEALLGLGELNEAVAILQGAARRAKLLQLPHQLERIERAASSAKSSAAADLTHSVRSWLVDDSLGPEAA